MSDHLTEEEQIEAIKSWWKENWMLVVVPVAVLLFGYGGWSFHKHSTEESAKEASAAYAQLIESVETTGQALSDAQIAAAQGQAETIIAEYSDSIYSDMANLILARLAADKGDYAAAAPYLQAVVSDAKTAPLAALAQVRLAKVKVELEAFDDALALVASTDQTAYIAQFAEVRGDIHYAQGSAQAAQTAYQEALDALTPEQQSRRGVLNLKLNGAKVNWSAAEAPAPGLIEPAVEPAEEEGES